PDEVTVVRTRQEPPPPVAPRRPAVNVPVYGAPAAAAPPVAANFNPLKVIIPSAIALLVVFAVIYALNRNAPAGNQNANQNTPALAADPNSQPVQAGQAPTGKSEEGIPAGGNIAPSANVNANANATVNPEVSPEPVEDVSPAANANDNRNSNTNANTNSNR